MRTKFLTVTAVLTGLVQSHGLVQSWSAGGSMMVGWDFWKKPKTAAWSSENGDNGFISAKELGSPNIICHKNSAPGTAYLDVKAGETIKMVWNAWADSHKACRS